MTREKLLAFEDKLEFSVQEFDALLHYRCSFRLRREDALLLSRFYPGTDIEVRVRSTGGLFTARVMNVWFARTKSSTHCIGGCVLLLREQSR